MIRNYKLAAYFNVVEITIDDADYEKYCLEVEEENNYRYEDGVPPIRVLTNEEWRLNILQEEYDILASIKVVDPIKTTPKVEENRTYEKPKQKRFEKQRLEKPTEKMISYAKALNIENAEKMDKQTLWQAIHDIENGQYYE